MSSLTFDERVRIYGNLESKSDAKRIDELYAKPQKWFVDRVNNVIGVGRVVHAYPGNIGHGDYEPTYQVKGRVETSDGQEMHTSIIILQSDVFDHREEAVRELVAYLESEIKKLHEEVNDIHGEMVKWRANL